MTEQKRQRFYKLTLKRASSGIMLYCTKIYELESWKSKCSSNLSWTQLITLNLHILFGLTE